MSNQRNSSTFICHTPLHILIACELIKLGNIDRFNLIYLVENRSEKNLYYYSMLSSRAVKSLYLLKRNSMLDSVKMLPLLSRLLLTSARKSHVYIGNLKTFYSRLVIWFLSPTTIYSFDDGIGNIKIEGIPGNNYFLRKNEAWQSRLFFSIFNKSLLYKNIINKVATHFTIYKLNNVYDNATYISLFPTSIKQKGSCKRLNVLLSSALALEDYMSIAEEVDFYNRIIKQFSIDLVIKHPRNEKYNPPKPCRVSRLLLIAEHQILDLVNSYELHVVCVFYSSVLVNLPREIKKTNVIAKNAKKDNPELKKLNDTLGIETVEI